MCFVQNFNIMFSDNICDLEQDIRNERYTLTILSKNSTQFKNIYWTISYLRALYSNCHCLGILPIWSLLMLASFP